MTSPLIVQQYAGGTFEGAPGSDTVSDPDKRIYGDTNPQAAGVTVVTGNRWRRADAVSLTAPGPPDPPPPPPVDPPPVIPEPTVGAPTTYVRYSDFTTRNAMISQVSGNFLSHVIYEMNPNTSTKRAQVAALTSSDTNPFRLMRFGGTSAAESPTNLDIGNFWLKATEQGHIYHGIIVGYSVGAHVHDVSVFGIPGLSSSPPTETMSLELWRSTGATVDDVLLDGRNSAGVAVAGSLLAYNFTTGTTTVNNLIAKHAKWGFAGALWRCVGHHIFNNCALGQGNRKSLNIEQSDGGTYEFNDCDFTGVTGANYVAQVSRRLDTTHPVPIEFHDCIGTGGPGSVLRVRTYPGYHGWDPATDDQDIRCYIGGVDVTNDPTKFLIVHS